MNMRTLQHKLIAFLYQRYLLNYIDKAMQLTAKEPRAWMYLAQQKINHKTVPVPLAVVEKIQTDLFDGLLVKTKKTTITDKCILYFHGGGFVVGSPELFVPIAYQLSKSSGLPVYLPNYPLLPQACHITIQAAANNAYDYLTQTKHIAPQNIAVGGDSAGGGLTLALINNLKSQDKALPGCWFGISPWVDLTLSTPSFNAPNDKDYILLFPKEWYLQIVADYAKGVSPEQVSISPLNQDFKGFPPGLIQSGGDERLLDENILLAQRLKIANNKVHHEIFADMPHAFQIIPLTESRHALQKIGQFVKSHFTIF